MLSSPVLVLNRYFVPVTITSVKRAFLMLYSGVAKAVGSDYETFDFDSWTDISMCWPEPINLRPKRAARVAPALTTATAYSPKYFPTIRGSRSKVFEALGVT